MHNLLQLETELQANHQAVIYEENISIERKVHGLSWELVKRPQTASAEHDAVVMQNMLFGYTTGIEGRIINPQRSNQQKVRVGCSSHPAVVGHY